MTLTKFAQRANLVGRHRNCSLTLLTYFPASPSINSTSFPTPSTIIAVFNPSAFVDTGLVTFTPSASIFFTKASRPFTSRAKRSRIVPLLDTGPAAAAGGAAAGAGAGAGAGAVPGAPPGAPPGLRDRHRHRDLLRLPARSRGRSTCPVRSKGHWERRRCGENSPLAPKNFMYQARPSVRCSERSSECDARLVLRVLPDRR